MLSPRELEREAGVIIARLFKKKAWLENKASSFDETKNWIIVTATTSRKTKTRSKKISSELIEAMCSANWLVRDPSGSLIATTAGLKKFVALSKGMDFSTQHQQQAERLIKDDQNRTVYVRTNETESPLGWMRARKDKSGKPLLSQDQFDAGERIRQDFTKAQMSARITASWEFTNPAGGRGSSRSASGNDGALEISERAYAAKRRFFSALDYLGPELSSIVYEVCCLASGLEMAERQFGWPRRSAKLVLTIALTKLSEHYGFYHSGSKQDGARQSGSAMIRHWGRQGYRPHIPSPEPEGL